ncbi:MAG: RHS repeat-associated core domain-containing protein [Bacteroidota bacterium]
MPKAYLNTVFFDEQFKFVSQNSEIVQVTTKGSGQTITRIDGSAKEAAKNGYAYIFVNNESNNFVYFDNLQVTHIRGPLLEETHYYPFGLTMAGISSKALAFGSLTNRYKFNDGTELEDKEFSDGSGLDLYATEFRGYDPQIGRFWQIDELASFDYDYSPYAFANNNPILLNDPLGLEAESSMLQPAPKETSTKDKPKELKPVVVTGVRKKPQSTSVGQPGFAESLIPVWGSGRAAVDDFQNGRWGWGIFNSVMAIADVFTFGGASTLVKGGVKTGIKLAEKEIVEEVTEEVVTKTTRTLLLNEGINITEDGFIHVMQRHYPRSGMFLSKSKFSIATREIVDLIKNSAQVPKILQRGGNYQRIVDAGKIIGVDAITGQATSKFTIITNKAGDLITSFPGLPGR